MTVSKRSAEALAMASALWSTVASVLFWPLDFPLGYAFIGGAYFCFAGWASYRLMQERHPFDPLAWFVFGSALLFGAGMIAPFVYPDFFSDYFTSEDMLVQELPMVAIVNYGSCLIVIVTAIFVSNHVIRSRLNYDVAKEIPIVVNRLIRGLSEKLSYLLLAGLFFGTLQAVAIFYPDVPLFGTIGAVAVSVGQMVAFIIGYGYYRYLLIEKVCAIFMVACLSVLGLVTLYKFNAAAPIALLALGILLRNGFGRRALFFLIILFVSYSYFIKPVVDSARLSPSYSLLDTSFSSRLSSLAFGLENLFVQDDRYREDDGGIIMRLSHVKYQAYLINEYNSGSYGETISDWYWGVVPRVLFPEKPDITRFGREFNDVYYRRNTESSSLALTYTAESYWNGGFFALLAVSIIYGFQIAILRVVLFLTAINREVLMFFVSPVIALFAYSVESTFVAHKVGGFFMLLLLLYFVHLLSATRFSLFLGRRLTE